MAEELLNKISSLRFKIIVIESMTGGGIINELTNIPGYSDFIYGGLCVYHISAKTELLGEVSLSVYSIDYAKKMCVDALETYSANIALSITGNTNPTDPLNNDFSSIFYIAFALREKDKSDNIIVIGKKIILDNKILNGYEDNNAIRRKFIKKIAIKTSIEFANESLKID